MVSRTGWLAEAYLVISGRFDNIFLMVRGAVLKKQYDSY